MARVAGTNLPVSTKATIEIAAFIRGKQIDKVIEYLQRVVEKKAAIPYKRYKEVGHRPGMAGGRYPKNASMEIIKLLNRLKKDAASKGLDSAKLHIIHSAACRGATLWHYGRRRTRRKNTRIELIAREFEIKQEEKKKTK
jgi:large subunit ribosomal protein L22